MSALCITQVSPTYPTGSPPLSSPATVVIRAVVWRSGAVTPSYAVSGPHSLEAAAMDAARLWKFKPYSRDSNPIDVTTELHVEFIPGQPGGMITHPHE